MMDAWLAVAAVSSVIAGGLLVISSRVASDDGRGWSRVWGVTALASLAALAIAWLDVPVAAVLPRVEWRMAPAEVVPSAVVSGALTLYWLGVVGQLLFWGAGWWQALQLRRRSRSLTAAEAALIARAGAADPSAFIVHPDLRTPVALGARVVLPDGFDRWAPERRLVVVRHEAAHVRRRDGRWLGVMTWYRIVFWPSPAAWAAARAWRRAAERACDADAAEAVDAVTCARVLVETAAGVLPSRLSAATLGAHTDLEYRVEALLALPARRAAVRVPRQAAGVVALVVVGAAVALTAAPPAAQRPAGGDHALRHAALHRH